MTKRKWYKYKNGNGHFFSPTPVEYYARSVSGDGSTVPTPKEALDHLNSLKPVEDGGASINEHGVYLCPTEKESAICDLPSGTYIYKPENYPLPDRLIPVDFRTDKYIQMDNITDKIVEDFNNFLANEQVYKDLEICFKSAALLFGPGGTGKTALIRYVVAEKLPKDAVVISINQYLPSTDFLATIKDTLKTRLKIFILEEFTHFVKDPFDCESILTFLDGESSVNKSYTFATTNYPEILPHNIVSRHSRIEFMYEISTPTATARKKLMAHYLKREITDEEVKLTDKMTADSIKALCLLTYTKKLSVVDAKSAIEEHLKLSKQNFKAKEMKIGF